MKVQPSFGCSFFHWSASCRWFLSLKASRFVCWFFNFTYSTANVGHMNQAHLFSNRPGRESSHAECRRDYWSRCLGQTLLFRFQLSAICALIAPWRYWKLHSVSLQSLLTHSSARGWVCNDGMLMACMLINVDYRCRNQSGLCMEKWFVLKQVQLEGAWLTYMLNSVGENNFSAQWDWLCWTSGTIWRNQEGDASDGDISVTNESMGTN